MLEKEEENAELRRRLGEMIRLVEAIRESEDIDDEDAQVPKPQNIPRSSMLPCSCISLGARGRDI